REKSRKTGEDQNRKRQTRQSKTKLRLRLRLRSKPKETDKASPQIRNAWDELKTVKQNLQDMGLSLGMKGMLPIKNKKASTKLESLGSQLVEASLRGEDRTTCSTDMTEYVQYMVKEHNQDYKAMARDKKNYYQVTPKQIKRKVELYKRCHPEEYAVFIASLEGNRVSVK
uniref:Nucleolar protein 16 n=1 Tax=Sinocyclocheilus grahami TaxID=75366 RepID=A0A672SYM2_SINGR